MLRRTFTFTAAAAALSVALAAASGPAAAQNKKLSIGLPGIPPIFSVTLVYVAEKQGFFKKHGVDVEVRPLDNGTAAALMYQRRFDWGSACGAIVGFR